MPTLNGYNVIVSNHIPMNPKIELSLKVDVSIDFRMEFNQWLLDTFGGTKCAYIINGNTLVISPEMMQELKLKGSGPLIHDVRGDL